MKNIKLFFLKTWNYFKNSWEDDKGQASWKRISQFFFLASMFGSGRRVHDQWTFYVFLTFAVIYILLSAIMTWQQIITLLKFTLPAMGKSPDNSPANEEMPQDFVQEVITQKT